MPVASTTPSDHAADTRAVTMPPPLSAPRFELADARTGRITCYADGPGGSPERPLLLIHSVNAAATAYEMKPLFEHYRAMRPVYALDLPGFGLSDRADRIYTPRIMTDAILLVVHEIRRRHGDVAIDALALSLGCEFAARAGTEAPNLFRSLALLSPTGFDRRAEAAAQKTGNKDATRAMPWVRNILNVPLWKHGFFTLLTSRASIRFFLRKTFGRKDIDESLLEYDYISTHQPGAENAPYSFVSGYLFSANALKLYQALAMPVWMVHGVRGDFVDYNGKHAVEGLPNWTIQVMQTGAMPHFEQLDKVVAGYDDFLARAAGA
ncbi:alpha/beta hydrolase [Bradyrhizobium sp. STM 3809]|uniref:alpha/beta fold hydrolase n=1 Tax=Bradyrhizobium sp. STM 3809 TaxID=551936 RepID=UPI00024091BC|nr:alpha/beta hydrolase [Bradyrhizobium sp. STM 3809]CCD98519.1 putative alpha/beta hydrolase fold [Bradyrhizobium sp. STM 3809]